MKTRARRSDEQRIEQLEAQIAKLKAKAEAKKAKKDPALKHVSAAVRSIDKAMAESRDVATRRALDEARSTLNACLKLSGAEVTWSNGFGSKRTARMNGSVDAGALLAYVQNNPGQRSEQLSAALGTDAATMRPVMKRLIEERKVKTKGERRGMAYFGV